MVNLGFGQAILGGLDYYGLLQAKIYHITCSDHICVICALENKELSVPRGSFVAIPIPDGMSGCISESKLGYCFV